MYTTCIFCSGRLGSNEQIAHFPVGRTLAFDAWKGRLWAVCGRCGRWNLAPLSERWEAVEEAERAFRDARTRVHHENIGLATLPNRARLVRVGEALPGELAAWRYGRELQTRRLRHWAEIAAGVAASVLVGVYIPFDGFTGQRVVYRAPNEQTGHGRDVRLKHLKHADIRVGAGNAARIHVPERGRLRVRPAFTIEGRAARDVLARVMLAINRAGASANSVQGAVQLLGQAPSAAEYLEQFAAGSAATQAGGIQLNTRIGGFCLERSVRSTFSGGARHLYPLETLALEMALHEEQERRALESELTLLQTAWREAEEIAAIADSLPES